MGIITVKVFAVLSPQAPPTGVMSVVPAESVVMVVPAMVAIEVLELV